MSRRAEEYTPQEPRISLAWLAAAVTILAALLVMAVSERDAVATETPTGAQQSKANPDESPAATTEGDTYSVHLPEPDVAAGGDATKVRVEIKAKKGWKWNMEFPARVALETEGPLKVTPNNLSKSAGNITVEGKNAALPLAIQGTAAGKGQVLLKANFSICSEEACKVYRNQEFRFPVEIR